ncbi:MAG: dipeptide/oligopeptide/nickel ABC transporter ATP-binding protein [Gammaproteobacteria bacterium]|jgi:peptide/nickel transport system ATP-binding protein
MTALIEARGISRVFTRGPGWWSAGRRRTQALKDVSLRLAHGASTGLVGESGCGKSTLARILIGLDRPTGGKLLWGGRDSAGFSRADWRFCWRRAQFVFQDAMSSLNPRHSLGRIVAAPIAALMNLTPAERDARVDELLDSVGLAPSLRGRYPHELSGGQAQRVVIARALAVDPELLILDEPVSALDVSIQAQILALLQELRERLDLGYLFISHDLAVVEQLCSEVVVMKDGRIVERGERAAVFGSPQTDYMCALLEAVPVLSR